MFKRKSYCNERCCLNYHRKMYRLGIRTAPIVLAIDEITPSETRAMNIGAIDAPVVPIERIQQSSGKQLIRTINKILAGDALIGSVR